METEREVEYEVVVNQEGQYSIWATYKPRPAGWSAVGQPGSKEACLAWIEENWKDMRPLSLVRALEAAPAAAIRAESVVPEPFVAAPSLVDRLCSQEQKLCVARCIDAKGFEAQLNRDYVLLSIPTTRGGTELGCTVAHWRAAKDHDFAHGRGTILLSASVCLDYEHLELEASIELATLEGSGKLKRRPPASTGNGRLS